MTVKHHSPGKDHPWGTTGHSVPPENIQSPELVDLIYGPHDITTTYDWILENMPTHSVLQMGEGRLMMGVLLGAVNDLGKEEAKEEAWKWIMETQSNGLYSFETICFHMNWNPLG